jgi:predicted membrane protein
MDFLNAFIEVCLTVGFLTIGLITCIIIRYTYDIIVEKHNHKKQSKKLIQETIKASRKQNFEYACKQAYEDLKNADINETAFKNAIANQQVVDSCNW